MGILTKRSFLRAPVLRTQPPPTTENGALASTPSLRAQLATSPGISVRMFLKSPSPAMSSKRSRWRTPAELWKTYIGNFAVQAKAAAITKRIGVVSEATDEPGPIGSLLLIGGTPGASSSSQGSRTDPQPS